MLNANRYLFLAAQSNTWINRRVPVKRTQMRQYNKHTVLWTFTRWFGGLRDVSRTGVYYSAKRNLNTISRLPVFRKNTIKTTLESNRRPFRLLTARGILFACCKQNYFRAIIWCLKTGMQSIYFRAPLSRDIKNACLLIRSTHVWSYLLGNIYTALHLLGVYYLFILIIYYLYLNKVQILTVQQGPVNFCFVQIVNYPDNNYRHSKYLVFEL